MARHEYLGHEGPRTREEQGTRPYMEARLAYLKNSKKEQVWLEQVNKGTPVGGEVRKESAG